MDRDVCIPKLIFRACERREITPVVRIKVLRNQGLGALPPRTKLRTIKIMMKTTIRPWTTHIRTPRLPV